MNRITLAALITGSVFFSSSFRGSAQNCPIVPYAVVELFTSQGCSYCPAAEEALDSVIAAEKLSGRNVICIAEHVHYWNNPWVDPFTDNQFSPRQAKYCQMLGVPQGTPEAFVNGKTITTPSPTIPAINNLVNNQLGSGNTPTAAVCLSLLSPVTAPTLTISYTLSGNITGADLIVCLVEDDLVTTPTSGENAGVTLHEDGVSRKFIVTPITSATGTLTLTPPANCVRQNSQIVAYVQNPNSMVIRGATRGVDLGASTTYVGESWTITEVELFPNPTTSNVTLTGATLSSEISYVVLNAMGQAVQKGTIHSENQQFHHTINLESLSAGFYFIRVSDDKSSFTKKISKTL